MSYYTGCVAAVPTANRQKYRDHAAATWALLKGYGATGTVEAWGADVPRGKVTDFHRAVEATAEETVVFSWITWPDRACADAAFKTMQSDPAMQDMPEMPFDGSRMIYGGFAPVFEQGESMAAGYYQGFVLAVPAASKAAYIDMAREGWSMFRDLGALGMVEGWGEDVPRGTRTDFYRAARAEDGEVAVFSWICWPDRATCDAAASTMATQMAGADMPQMPFDGRRMMWAGFEPLFESHD